jgi:biotin carboxylase
VDGGAQIYDREDLLDASGPVQDALAAYVMRVLDALEIRWGPAHSEVMMTAEGPVLIELGARMQGAIVPDALAACLGEDPVTLTCRCYTQPDRFPRGENGRYRRRRRAVVVNLISRRAGVVTETVGLDRVRGLPTFFGLIGDRKVGDRIDRTTDFVSSPGFIYLVGDAAEELERDYLLIREWEVEGLYRLAPD